jgi:hypothetical protein
MTFRGWLVAAGATAIWLALPPHAESAHAGSNTCRPETVTIDRSLGQAYIPVFLGSAVGQTFMAMDTLVRSISVWRWANPGQADYGVPMKLWLVRTRPSGMPNSYDVLLEGSIMRTPADSGAGRPIKVRYDFDPPFALPSPGLYAFFIQDPCLLLAYILADTSRNVYPLGSEWQIGRAPPGSCRLEQVWREFPRSDLIFDIEFCRSAITPALRRTWGEIKTIYR